MRETETVLLEPTGRVRGLREPFTAQPGRRHEDIAGQPGPVQLSEPPGAAGMPGAVARAHAEPRVSGIARPSRRAQQVAVGRRRQGEHVRLGHGRVRGGLVRLPRPRDRLEHQARRQPDGVVRHAAREASSPRTAELRYLRSGRDYQR